MGTGWRRALCTSVQRDDDPDRDASTKKRRPQQDAPSPRGTATATGFFSAVKSAATGSSSNPSTPVLRCRTRPTRTTRSRAPHPSSGASSHARGVDRLVIHKQRMTNGEWGGRREERAHRNTS